MIRKRAFVFNVPNVLTLFRLLLIPVCCWLIIIDKMKGAFIIFVLASLTDVLDGYIARKYNQITDFGKLVDPLADKLMVLCLMITFSIMDVLPSSAIYIIFVKDSLLILGGILLYRKQFTVQADIIGKIAQFFLVLSIVLSFFQPEFDSLGFPLYLYTLWVGVAVGIIAFIHYSLLNAKYIFPSKKA